MTEIKYLIARSTKMFSGRTRLEAQWQEQSENFWPERADFITAREPGTEYAPYLYTADAVMMCRDLANAFSWLRAKDRNWFELRVEDDDLNRDPRVKGWLQKQTLVIRRAIYDRRANFSKSMKEAERSYATFGTGILSIVPNQLEQRLQFRAHHLRDVACSEDADGAVDTVARKIKMTARQMAQMFNRDGDTLHNNVTRALEKTSDQDQEFDLMHFVMPAADYEFKAGKRKADDRGYATCYLDVSNNVLIREGYVSELPYVVPRWETISGSPYGVSPAAAIALPEARYLQMLARVVQEASEKAIDPPLLAIEEKVRGDVHLEPGGTTWVDVSEYDSSKMGDIVKPLFLAKNPSIGLDLMAKSIATLRDAWFISKLDLPTGGPERTAYEIEKRIEESIRANVPLIEPVEDEFYTPTLETSAAILIRNGAFGAPETWPQALRGRDLRFIFTNPLRDTAKRAKVNKFNDMVAEIAQSKAAFPTVPVEATVDVVTAFYDVLDGIAVPADWQKKKEDAIKDIDAINERNQAGSELNNVGAAAGIAEQVGKAGQALNVIPMQQRRAA